MFRLIRAKGCRIVESLRLKNPQRSLSPTVNCWTGGFTDRRLDVSSSCYSAHKYFVKRANAFTLVQVNLWNLKCAGPTTVFWKWACSLKKFLTPSNFLPGHTLQTVPPTGRWLCLWQTDVQRPRKFVFCQWQAVIQSLSAQKWLRYIIMLTLWSAGFI